MAFRFFKRLFNRVRRQEVTDEKKLNSCAEKQEWEELLQSNIDRTNSDAQKIEISTANLKADTFISGNQSLKSDSTNNKQMPSSESSEWEAIIQSNTVNNHPDNSINCVIKPNEPITKANIKFDESPTGQVLTESNLLPNDKTSIDGLVENTSNGIFIDPPLPSFEDENNQFTTKNEFPSQNIQNIDDIESILDRDEAEEGKREKDLSSILLNREVDAHTRAKQLAIEMLDTYYIDYSYLKILIEIFESGSSLFQDPLPERIRKPSNRIKLLVEAIFDWDTSPNELSLMFQIKRIWQSNDYFWSRTTNKPDIITGYFFKPYYQNISWFTAHQLIKKYPHLKTIIEWEHQLNLFYEQWKHFLKKTKYEKSSFYGYIVMILKGMKEDCIFEEFDFSSYAEEYQVNWNINNDLWIAQNRDEYINNMIDRLYYD